MGDNKREGTKRPLNLVFKIVDKEGNILSRDDAQLEVVVATRNSARVVEALQADRDVNVLGVEVID